MRRHKPLFRPAGRPVATSTAADRSILDPGRLLPVLRRYWAWLILPPLLLAAAGYFFSSRQPSRYEASTSLLFQQTAAEDRLDGDRSNEVADREVQTEERLLNGRAFQADVTGWLGSDIEFKAQAVEGTDVVELEVLASTGPLAAQAVDEIAARYVEQRQAAVRADLADGIGALQQIVDDLKAELEVVDRALVQLTGSAASGPAASIPSPSVQSETEPALRRRQTALADELLIAEAALRSLENEAILTSGDVSVAGSAVVPDEPVSPRPLRTTVLWGVLGTLIGMGLVWLRDVSDRRLRDGGDLLPIAPELEFSGRVPRPVDLPSTGPVVLLSEEVADRFRVLASSSVTPNGGSTVIQVVGLRGGEGATYVAVNLAVTLAAGGWRTALVDADLNSGGVHRVFDLDMAPGTLDVLTGDPLSSVIGDSPMVPGLGIIPRGNPDISPTVHNSSFTKMVNGLRSRFDAVIIDSPAILASGDAEVVSRHVDKTVVVAEVDTSSRDDLQTAVGLVRRGGGLVSGVVLVESTRSVSTVSPSGRSVPRLGKRRESGTNGDRSIMRPQSALGSPSSHPADRRVPRVDHVIDHRNGTTGGGRSSISGDETNVHF